MVAGFTRRDAASKKGTVMPETTEPVTESVTQEPVVTTGETPLGEAGLAALKAEREARASAEKRLKEFEDRDKTEAERSAEKLAAAEKRADELEAKAIRAEVAAAKGVPANLLTGVTVADLEASADALIAFRGEQTGNKLVVRNEGKSSGQQSNSEQQFARDLFARGD